MATPPRQFQQELGILFPRPPRATMALMIATAVASVAAMFDARTYGALTPVRLLLDFTPSQVLDGWKIWTPFTYLFLANGVFNLILYEVFGLWMFASRLEAMWGPRRFLFFFFGTGTGAALVTTLAAAALPALRLAGPASFPGTWVALDAILLGWVLMNWHATVFLLFIPVRAPYLLLFGLLVPLLYIVQGLWEPFVPVFAGMGIGYLMLRKRSSVARRLWLQARAWWIDRKLKRRSRHLRVVPPPKRKPGDRQEPPTWLH